MSYVAALFAFHSARASVVSVAQPTVRLLRTTHGLDDEGGHAEQDDNGERGLSQRPDIPGDEHRECYREQGEARVREDGQPGDRTGHGDVAQRAFLGGDENGESERRRKEVRPAPRG